MRSIKLFKIKNVTHISYIKYNRACRSLKVIYSLKQKLNYKTYPYFFHMSKY